MSHYPYRSIAVLSIILLIPADMYFLASMTQAAALQDTLIAHPQVLLRIACAFLPFIALGVVLHYLWLLALLNRCEITVEDGMLQRIYGPLFPHFALTVPIEDVHSLFIESRVQHTRRGSAARHLLKVKRRSGKTLTLLGGSARPSLLRTVQSNIEKHLAGPWSLPAEV